MKTKFFSVFAMSAVLVLFGFGCASTQHGQSSGSVTETTTKTANGSVHTLVYTNQWSGPASQQYPVPLYGYGSAEAAVGVNVSNNGNHHHNDRDYEARPPEPPPRRR